MESSLEIKNSALPGAGSGIVLNKRRNAYQCTKCQSLFRNKSRLKDHLLRQSPCGLITNESLGPEILRDFVWSNNAWKDIPKIPKNKEKLRKLLRRQFTGLERYCDIPETTLAEIRTELIDNARTPGAA